MGTSLTDLFRAETEFNVKASEMYAVIQESVKAELLMNGIKCEVPYAYLQEVMTGKKKDGIQVTGITTYTPEKISKLMKVEQAAGQDVKSGSGSVGIVRKHEQRVEWIDIQDIIRKGRAGVSLPPGTEINFTLKNGDQASAVVVGVDHYEKGDCVFWFRKIVGRHCMNKNGTNKGGFPGADDMREYLEEIYSLLPDELQSVIALHKTVQKIDGEMAECEGRLFLMSMYEGRGANDWSEYNGTDKQFPYFEDRINRIAYDDDGDPVWYWTADPFAAYTSDFCFFDTDGISDAHSASDDGGVAPLFVIK